MTEQDLWIDDTPLPSLSHIRAESVSLKAHSGLGLVMIDYVQLVKGAGNNRYEELRDVAYGLKALAKNLAVPIVVLAQLNRNVEARDQKRPNLSDLRNSGAIEEAADIVGMLYRESHYHQNCSMPDVLECQIEKNRNGELHVRVLPHRPIPVNHERQQSGILNRRRQLRATRRALTNQQDLRLSTP